MNHHPVNLHDHEALARATLGEAAWAYFSRGAADESRVGQETRAWRATGL